MKKLTLIEQDKQDTNLSDFEYIEQKFNVRFPEVLKQFILKYESSSVKETVYQGTHTFKEILNLKKHPVFASIESMLEGYAFYGKTNLIPFAIDSGGWSYNVSIAPETYGQVWLDKFDSDETNTLEFVCDNFELFINSLEAEAMD